MPSLPKKYGYQYGPAYAGYDVSRDLILVGTFVTPRGSAGKINAESCIAIVEDFRDALVTFSGASDPHQLASQFWFSHSGYQSNAMPPNFVNDLTNHITVVTHLDLYPTLDSAFTCEEPLIGGSTSVAKKQTK